MAFRSQEVGQVQADGIVLRRKRHPFRQGFQGLYRLCPIRKQHAQGIPGRSEGGFLVGHVLEALDRRLIVALLGLEHAELEPGRGEVRGQGHAVPVLKKGFLWLVQLLVEHGEPVA
ncbi:hypothetical protein D3C72_2002460 [compost metagenome]